MAEDNGSICKKKIGDKDISCYTPLKFKTNIHLLI